MDDYLHEARWMPGAPLRNGFLEEIVRSGGSIARYRFLTNDFVAGTPDGEIKTFFKPVDREAYWEYEHIR